MFKINGKSKNWWLGFGFLVCSLILCFSYERSIKTAQFPLDYILHLNSEDFPKILQRKNIDLTQMFVPHGIKYKPKAGKIYECVTRDVYSREEPVNKTRDFRLDTWNKSGENQEARSKSFREIFEKQSWYGKKPPKLSRLSPEYRASGPGSLLEEAQRALALLNCLVDRLKFVLKKPVISMVDIPCGDFYWMRHFVGPRTDIRYTGIDIVPTLISRHKNNFRDWEHVEFKNLDIVTAGLNQSYDFIFSRDMLQHLTHADAMKILEHFSKSGSKLLVTTNLLSSKNVEIDVNGPGRYRHLNLMLPPINLVPPICSMADRLQIEGIKELSIWTLPLQQRV